MQFSLDTTTANQIASYEAGEITINKTSYHTNLIITPETIISPWECQALADFSLADVNLLSNLNAEVVIIGTGSEQQFLQPDILAKFSQQRIGIEMMNTLSACRTYNLLAAEGRAVAAALIIR